MWLVFLTWFPWLSNIQCRQPSRGVKERPLWMSPPQCSMGWLQEAWTVSQESFACETRAAGGGSWSALWSWSRFGRSVRPSLTPWSFHVQSMHTHGLGQENQTPVCSREEKQWLKGVFRLHVCADFSRTQNKKSSGEIDPRRENEALPGPVPSAVNAFVGKNAEFMVHLQGDWSKV